jgi:hypothetical protein
MSQIIAVDFLAGGGLSSRLIEFFGIGGRNGYSHAASVLKDGRYLDARFDRIAGVDPGVQIRHPETESWVRKRRAWLEVSDADYAAWEASLRAKITDGYGSWDILDMLDGSEWHEPGHWICSALAVNAVQHMCRSSRAPIEQRWTPPRTGYVPYPLWIPAHQVTPDMLLTLLQVAGWTIEPEQSA